MKGVSSHQVGTHTTWMAGMLNTAERHLNKLVAGNWCFVAAISDNFLGIVE